MATVRVGLIGAGFIAELHATALTGVRNAELVAIASQHGERARELAERFDIPHVEPSGETLLERDDVDVVTLAVPNDLHAALCIAAAGQGKHVIVEKPLCRTLDEADAMIAACRDAGVKLMYGETLALRSYMVSARGATTTPSWWSRSRAGRSGSMKPRGSSRAACRIEPRSTAQKASPTPTC